MDQQYREHIADLLKEGKKADKLDKERVELFMLLLKHPAWPLYVTLLDSKIQAFADAVMSPASSVDGAVALEYVKGAMSGLIIARDLPSITVAAMKAAIPASGEDE